MCDFSDQPLCDGSGMLVTGYEEDTGAYLTHDCPGCRNCDPFYVSDDDAPHPENHAWA